VTIQNRLKKLISQRGMIDISENVTVLEKWTLSVFIETFMTVFIVNEYAIKTVQAIYFVDGQKRTIY